IYSILCIPIHSGFYKCKLFAHGNKKRMARADIHLRLGFVFNISINYTKGLQSNNLTVIDPSFYFHHKWI
ncbi:hypothetical protein CP554_23165, partial [Klebsiella pneumoniae]